MIIAICSLLLSTLFSKDMFFLIYVLSISYILLFIAYVPAGLIRGYNKAGDYSYGTYIYAYPIQQSIVALSPGIAPLPMFLMSAFVTLLLAVCSWHFIERRALGLKGWYVDYTKKMFTYSHKNARKAVPYDGTKR